MLAHKLVTTSCGTSVKVKWPSKEEFEWLSRDGKKRLFSAKRPMRVNGVEDISTAKSSEHVALEFLVNEYEKFFQIHTESWREQSGELAIRRMNPMALANKTFGDDKTLYLKGGNKVETAVVGKKKKWAK